MLFFHQGNISPLHFLYSHRLPCCRGRGKSFFSESRAGKRSCSSGKALAVILLVRQTLRSLSYYLTEGHFWLHPTENYFQLTLSFSLSPLCFSFYVSSAVRALRNVIPRRAECSLWYAALIIGYSLAAHAAETHVSLSSVAVSTYGSRVEVAEQPCGARFSSLVVRGSRLWWSFLVGLGEQIVMWISR